MSVSCPSLAFTCVALLPAIAFAALTNSLDVSCDYSRRAMTDNNVLALTADSCPAHAFCDSDALKCVCDHRTVSFAGQLCLERRSLGDTCLVDRQCRHPNSHCAPVDRDGSSARQIWFEIKHKQELNEIRRLVGQSAAVRFGSCECEIGYAYDQKRRECSAKEAAIDDQPNRDRQWLDDHHSLLYDFLEDALNNRSQVDTNLVAIKEEDLPGSNAGDGVGAVHGQRNPINKIILIFSLMFVFAVIAEIIVKLLSKTYYNNHRAMMAANGSLWPSYRPASASSPPSAISSSARHGRHTPPHHGRRNGSHNTDELSFVYALHPPSGSVSRRFLLPRSPPLYHQLPVGQHETLLLLDETDGVAPPNTVAIGADDKPPSYEEAVNDCVVPDVPLRPTPSETQL